MQHATCPTDELHPIDGLGLDEFERGILKVLRQFLVAHQAPETQAWHRGFLIAVERWGEPLGLAAAHASSKFLKALLRGRGDLLTFNDPLSTLARDFATDHEALMMIALHALRRDQTSTARDAISELTNGRLDPEAVHAGLAFASRFSAGCDSQERPPGTPALRLVK
ncbi:MAG: hypothetical protein AAF718_04545 [Pseudomonadota bacterium]